MHNATARRANAHAYHIALAITVVTSSRDGAYEKDGWLVRWVADRQGFVADNEFCQTSNVQKGASF